MATVAKQRPLLIVDTPKVADYVARAQGIRAELAGLKVEDNIIQDGGHTEPKLADNTLRVARQEIEPLRRTARDLAQLLREEADRIDAEVERVLIPLREPIVPWTPEQQAYVMRELNRDM